MAKKRKNRNKTNIKTNITQNKIDTANKIEVKAAGEAESEPTGRAEITARDMIKTRLALFFKKLDLSAKKLDLITKKLDLITKKFDLITEKFGLIAKKLDFSARVKNVSDFLKANPEAKISASLAALSLIVGISAYLIIPSNANAAHKDAARKENVAEVMIRGAMLTPASVKASVPPAASPTLAPVEVGVPQTNGLDLIIGSAKTADYSDVIGTSESVSYDKSLTSMTTALNSKNPFDVFQTVYTLKVNGEAVAYFRSPSEPKEVIDKITGSNVSPNSKLVKTEYLEDISIEKEAASFLSVDSYSTVDKAAEYLMTGTKENRKYHIVAGDIPETIAEAHGMTIDELEAANPQIVGRGHLLQIGEELNLTVPVPIVNVVTTEEVNYSTDVAFEVIEKKDENMYEGESEITVKGETGKSEVRAEVVKQNGVEISRKIISQKITKEPSAQHVIVGAKPAPPRKGTGSFDYPISRGSYSVSSLFGPRWGRMHTGVDMACSTGTPIIAADGGQVIYAGYDGSYGYTVRIDHGGNLVTVYAHCSYINVTEGEMVFKGQYIADVGNTGLSFGSHLHFEILKNGVHVDPADYLEFWLME